MKIISIKTEEYGGLIGNTAESWTKMVTIQLEPGDLDGENPISDEKLSQAIETAGLSFGYNGGPGRPYSSFPSYRVDPDTDPDHVLLHLFQRGGWDV